MINFSYRSPIDPWLFPHDIQIPSWPVLRNYIGEYFEQKAAHLLGARRCKTDGTKTYCPDLHWHDNVFVECKASGRNGSVIIYKGRATKDISVLEQGNRLYYCIFKHSTACRGINWLSELHTSLEETNKEILLVPAELVIDATLRRPIRRLNSQYSKNHVRMGYGTDSKGYGEGWCLRFKELWEECKSEMSWHGMTVRWAIHT